MVSESQSWNPAGWKFLVSQNSAATELKSAVERESPGQLRMEFS